MPRRHRAEQSQQLPHLGPDIVRANGLVLEPSGRAGHRLGRPSIFPIIPNTEAFFSGWTYLNGRASCVLKVKATRIYLAHTVNGASLERKLFLFYRTRNVSGLQPCNISEECRKVQVFRGTPPRGISPVEVFCRNRMSARFHGNIRTTRSIR